MSAWRIRCEPLGVVVEARPGETVFAALRRAGVPVGSACDAEGICGRCGLALLEGRLTAPGPLERRVAADNRLSEGQRISCLARPLSDVTVRASYW